MNVSQRPTTTPSADTHARSERDHDKGSKAKAAGSSAGSGATAAGLFKGAGLIGLQRAAGNAAVASLLGQSPTEGEPPGTLAATLSLRSVQRSPGSGLAVKPKSKAPAKSSKDKPKSKATGDKLTDPKAAAEPEEEAGGGQSPADFGDPIFDRAFLQAIEIQTRVAKLRKSGKTNRSPEIQSLLQLVDKQFMSVATGDIRTDLPDVLVKQWLPSRGEKMTNRMLDDSERVARQEGQRYGGSGGPGDAPALRKAAAELAKGKVDLEHEVERLEKEEESKDYYPGTGAGSRDPAPGDAQQEAQQKIADTRKDFEETKKAYGAVFPILMVPDLDFDKVAKADDGTLKQIISGAVGNTLTNINESRENLQKRRIDIWNLAPVIEQVKQVYGIEPGSYADQLIERERERRSPSVLETVLSTVLMIGLGVVATFATGGVALGALLAGFTIGGMQALDLYADYDVKKAAHGTDLDVARAISSDDPSLFWLAVAIVGAVVDLGAAVQAFRSIGRAAREMEKLEQVARAEAQRLASEGHLKDVDQFVSRIMKSARAVQGAEGMRARSIVELLQGASPRVVSLLAGDEKAAAGLLKQWGNWKELMQTLEHGTPEMKTIGQNLLSYRKGVVAQLERPVAEGGFGAKLLGRASKELISDVDVQVTTGALMQKAEQHMSRVFGNNWEKALRMNFYTEAGRLSKYADVMKTLPRSARAALQTRITARAEQLNLAKMLHHAGKDREAVARVEALIKSVVSDEKQITEIRSLAVFDEATGLARRNKLLTDVDAKMAKFASAGKDEQLKLAEEISDMQMEANFYTTEAYIGPGAGRAAAGGIRVIGPEAYQRAMSELEMFEHVMHESGGDILKACREYELYKYISRFGAAARGVGYTTKKADYLEKLSEYIYGVFRGAHDEHVSGLPAAWETTRLADRFGVPMPRKVDDSFLRSAFDDFTTEAHTALPEIKKRAMHDAADWAPDVEPASRAVTGANQTKVKGMITSDSGASVSSEK